MARYFKMINRIIRGARFLPSAAARHGSVPLVLLASCQAEDSNLNCSPKCEPIKFLDAGELSHEALIRQACLLATNSSSQLITQVLVAITDSSKNYREAMSTLMSLLENSIVLLSNSVSPFQNDIEDLIVEHRNAVDEQRKAVMELVSLMQYVDKMVTSTAETAFLAGAEESSTLMCERLNSALEKVVLECAINKEAEEELLKLQQVYVIRLGEASKNSSLTEEQPPELSRTQTQDDKSKDNIFNSEASEIFNQDIFENYRNSNSNPSFP